jgi:hypothetical protein
MRSLLFGLAIVWTIQASAQSTFPYTITLDPIAIPELPGIHSFAWAQHEGKWLIAGGRLDGLHPRQPWASFPASSNNQSLIVIDPVGQQFWTRSLSELPVGIQEQLQSTNLNFHQLGDTLYIAGGYAYAASADDHITHPALTSIEVSNTINAIINDQPIDGFFDQLVDDQFAVTGGQMAYMNGRFYLVGGQRFDGRYNPMGNPTYEQTYTNAVRSFELQNSPELAFSNYTETFDEVHLHRRDYNLLPFVFEDGEEGFLISSGVFQVDADLPYLYPVEIRSDSHLPRTEFNQYLSNYHSAHTELFDAENNEMHAILFGGMSQYYYSGDQLIQDDQVPFVRTISRLTRHADGSFEEFLMPIEMPALKGASAEFIPNPELSRTANGVLLLNELTADSVLIGYIVGGIQSTSLNPFSTNQLGNTSADATIYEVWLHQSVVNSVTAISAKNPLSMIVYPNPAKRTFTAEFSLPEGGEVYYYITNPTGKVIQKGTWNLGGGKHSQFITLPENTASGTYSLTVSLDGVWFTTNQVIVE